jgi:sporulation protein YlmC with PRC-barrel domain
MVNFDTLTRLSVNATDAHLGHVKDVLFDDQDFVVRYLALDTSQWMPLSKKVLISPISVKEINLDDVSAQLSLSEKLVKDSPPLDAHKPVCREYEEVLFKYFGYGYYWVGPGAWGEFAHPTELANFDPETKKAFEEQNKPKHNHLRSVREIIGYNVCTNGESIGHISDFVVDQDTWSITHLEVELGNWLPGGKRVRLDVNHCEKIDWPSHAAYLTVSKDMLEQMEATDT